ncbi:MAG: gliding motility-associated C-terminal domain-containing protein [Flavobacteriales bacterium]|jgi:gliding motility-associated-like protein|nr:gliding motility-associated C-terminal domain-containing protein [Flavobacteriales bacterium]
MKKLLLLLLLIPFSFITSWASHIVGGDISVQWQSQNNYTITVRVYRDCENALVSMPSDVEVGIYEIGTNNQIATYTINRTTLNNNLSFGDACYTPTDICVDEGIFVSNTITIPDFAAGYYLSTQLYARNSIIDNIDSPGSTGMTFFAEIPDPAFGQNSSPDFGAYPSDAYLCVTGVKEFSFNLTDADGDSLVYSLVDPLASIGTSDGTNAGSGAYPYYSSITWDTGFSLANICGGSPAMSINSQTGVITAAPNVIGVYVFAVRVEEYRNGVKIGEVRRDVQYASLACTLDTPPTIDLEDTVDVYVASSICIDVMSSDSDGTDTIYSQVFSDDFDVNGTYVAPDTLNNNLYYLNYGGNDTLWINHLDTVNNVYEGIGEIPLRYCWTASCLDVDSIYHLNILSYSLGCSGSDTTEKDVAVRVVYNPLPFELNVPSNLFVSYSNELCFDVLTQDTAGTGEILSLKPLSSNFDHLGSYVAPSQLNGQSYYAPFMGQDTMWINNHSYDGNGTVSAIGNVPIKYCWTPNCDDVFQTEFDIEYQASITLCEIHSQNKTMHVTVEPPQGEVKPVANVFTPNGADGNDYFKLDGTSDPCYDVMDIEIFNRWGKKVFESTDPHFKWDGKHHKTGLDCAEGVYYVIIDGTYGSQYDLQGNRIPNVVRDQFTVYLMR